MGMIPRTAEDKAETYATFRATVRLLSRLRAGADLTVDIDGDAAKVLTPGNYPAGPYRGSAQDLRVALDALLSAKLVYLALAVEQDLDL